mgnify:CR=1 FL=1
MSGVAVSLMCRLWRLLPERPRCWLYRSVNAVWWRSKARCWQFHDTFRDLAWRQGYRVRAVRPRRSGDAASRTVLHVTSSFDLGGTQTQIKHLCTAAPTRFHHRAAEIFPEINYLYRRGVTLDRSRYSGSALFGDWLADLIANPNWRSSQLVQIYKVYRDIQAERPAIVVGWGHEMCVTTFLAAALAGTPTIVFCIRTVNPTYGWSAPPLPELLLAAHRGMRRYVDAMIVNSTLLQQDHAAWAGIPPQIIEVCPNGITATRLPSQEEAAARARVRASYGIADGATVILNVGRFSMEKGQPSLVEANRRLRQLKGLRPFVFLMCGDGATLEEVKASAASMDNMIFAGRTDRVAEFLAAADIFVMPSDFEGMPNAMMEAMAAGLPCISTNRSGALDVARHEREALYYEPRDAAGLARHLERWLQNPAEARAFGEAAARRITEFSVDRFVERFERILDETRSAGVKA